MTSDRNQPGPGPWMPQWGGEPSGRPQPGHEGPHGGPQRWGQSGGRGEQAPYHRGPWGSHEQWDPRGQQGPWRSHGEHDQHGPQSAPPPYGWRFHGRQQQQWDPRDRQEGGGRRWGGCGGHWRHGDQQGTHSHGPSWAGVALTGAGAYGLYKLFQGGRQ